MFSRKTSLSSCRRIFISPSSKLSTRYSNCREPFPQRYLQAINGEIFHPNLPFFHSVIFFRLSCTPVRQGHSSMIRYLATRLKFIHCSWSNFVKAKEEINLPISSRTTNKSALSTRRWGEGVEWTEGGQIGISHHPRPPPFLRGAKELVKDLSHAAASGRWMLLTWRWRHTTWSHLLHSVRFHV